MAAVDSFDLFLRNFVDPFSDARDLFAILGAYYALRKSVTLTRLALKALRLHCFGRLFQYDFRETYGPWAVTGSSEGIGKAYAQELASRGMNLVLISKEESKLNETAKDIEQQFGVQVCTLVLDFSFDVYSTIWQEIQDKKIGILVNNVGVMYEYPQYFLDVPVKKLWQLVHVNVTAATMMTHLILPQMVERGKGAIVMISSGSCRKITPQMTVYAATKSYLDYFAQALHYEYKSKGIVVQSLLPFYVATRMTRFSTTLSNPNVWIPSASIYARSAVSTLGFSTRTSGYFPHMILAWITFMIPDCLWKWASTRLNNALRRQAEERLKSKRLSSVANELFSFSEAS